MGEFEKNYADEGGQGEAIKEKDKRRNKSDGIADDGTSHTPDGRGDEQESVGFRTRRRHSSNLQDFGEEGKEGRVGGKKMSAFDSSSMGRLDIGLGIADEVGDG